jgi:acyl-CoA synthetase (AMP-forming)/AMP-acid ligase II/NAD(P)-dependent dehydrogenase (short-subunit alcohol dehydrogenase family)
VLAHSDTPVDRIVAHLRPDREAGGNPLFQVLFALQNFADQRLKLGGLAVERLDDEEESTRFDLELHVWDHGDQLRGGLVFDTELFDRDTAERMTVHLGSLLDSALAAASEPVTALPLRSADEERRLRERMAAAGPLAILDGHGRVPPANVPGDVWVTAAIGQPAHRTGERGRVRPDATVEILTEIGSDGQVPRRVRVDDRHVVLADVEEALLRADPELADVVVLPRSIPGVGTQLVAYTSSEPRAQATATHGLDATVVVSAIPSTVDIPVLLRLPVADAVEADRLERRLADAGEVGRVAVLVADAEPAEPADAADPAAPVARRTTMDALVAGHVRADAAPALVDGGPAVAHGMTSLADALRRAAESTPDGRDDIVVIDGEGARRRLTYRQLLEAAGQALGGLRAAGSHTGDPVILQLDDHVDFMTVLWACLLGGLVAVPLATPVDYRHPDATTERLLGACELLDHPLVVTVEGRLSEIRDATAVRAVSLTALLDGAGPTTVDDADLDRVALLMLTSGSSGAPKAVVLRHSNILARCAGTVAVNGFGPRDTSFNWMPLDHVGGVVMFHLRDVFAGSAQVHAATRWVLHDPLRWLDSVEEFRATVTWAPNFAFGLINDRAASLPERGRDWDLSRLRFVLNGGEAIVARVARRWLALLAPYGLPATAMRPAWGMSETSSAFAYSDRFTLDATSDDDTFVEVGLPLPGSALRIVAGADIDETTVVGEGEIGRLQVRGAAVTTGYHGAGAHDVAAFTPDGWFSTGDLGRVRAGRLTITGRAKDVVIVNGVNYYSHDIEAAVEELGCVEPSYTAAVGVRTPGATTDELVVFVLLRGMVDRDDAMRQVRQAVRQRAGLNPRHVVCVERADIPKTEIGKIQRALLRARFEAGAYATGPGAEQLYRPAWLARGLRPAPQRGPADGDILLFLDSSGVGRRLAELLGAAGRRCVTVESGMDGAVGERRWAVVAYLRSYGEAEAETEDGTLAGERHDLLRLARELQTEAFFAVTSQAHVVDRTDPYPIRAALAGLVASLAHERPDFRVSHLDVPVGDPGEVADLLVAELSRLPRERAVAYRGGRRLVRRLLPIPAPKGGAREPFRRGGHYLVTGADGGIGRLLVRELTATHGAAVLAVGRTEVPEGARVPGVSYAIADVCDPAALARALHDAERGWGAPVDGVLHLAGVYQERPLAQCTPAELDRVLAAKVDGAGNLYRLLADRPGTLFVLFSSVNGFFGGASVGAYAAANAQLDGLAAHLRYAGGLDAYSLAWSMWDETGMSAGHALKTLTVARGYRVLAPAEAIRLLTVALGHDEPHQLIGLDPTRPWIAVQVPGPVRSRHRLVAYSEGMPPGSATDRYGTPFTYRSVVLDTLPVDPVSGAVDRLSLPRPGTGGSTVDSDQLRPGLETVIAATWAEVLGLDRVGATANFFDLGGGSLQATRVHSLLSERLDRPMSMVELFRRPTVRALADALQPDEKPVAPAGQRGRGRAERRLRAEADRRRAAATPASPGRSPV